MPQAAAVPGATRLVPVGPQRLLDTRDRGTRVPDEGTVRVVVPGSGVLAAVVTVTVTETTGPGFVTVWPADTPRPLASNLNVERADQTLANLAVVRTGNQGALEVFVQRSLHVVVDLSGVFVDAAAPVADGRFEPVGPVRVLDTRSGRPLGRVDTVVVPVATRTPGASAVVVNVTATEALAPGFLTVHPDGAQRPLASNLNVERAGQTVSNLAVVPVGPTGDIRVFSQSGTHLVVDLLGMFTGPTAAVADTGRFVPVSPTRFLDTRSNLGMARPVDSWRSDVSVPGLPAGAAAAVLMNLTATESTRPGFVTAYPAGTAWPGTSNLNLEQTWQTRANLALVRLGSTNAISLYAQRSTQLVGDLAGWFTGAPVPVESGVPAAAPPPANAPSGGPLVRLGVVGDRISPKSVVATGTGLFFAQNMMYSHTMTVYDRDLRLVRTISDNVGGRPGAPVEAAVSADGRSMYVSNYAMYGPGDGPEGFDDCLPSDPVGSSTVYRVDLASLTIDQVIPVGKVPKYLATSPDGRWLVVSNWCGDDVSIVDVALGREVRRVPIGRNPRGVAITADSKTAYIAAMGAYVVAVVDLESGTVTRRFTGLGTQPRHANLSPDGRWLYVTLAGNDQVAKIDTTTGAVVGRAVTGNTPRSAVLTPDGSTLYVVNYFGSSFAQVRTSDMTVTAVVPVSTNPIGVTYDAESRQVWVACYVGRIHVFAEQ
jgi:YVTN family beta-propeller protein